MTTLPAPTIAFSPMHVFGRIVAPVPIDAPCFTTVRLHFPICFGLEFPIGTRGARIGVVGKHDPVADEDVVFNRDAFTDEGVARNLASATDLRVLLDLDKCANLRLVSDLTTIEVDEFRETNVLAQFHVVRNAVKGGS